MNFPSFDEQLSFLNQFILALVDEYHAGEIDSWDALDEKVKSFFTPERMEQTESLVPGWKKMASYSDGITLTHVMCVFLGVFIMPEFQALTPEEQQIAKWFVLFHDIDKFHIRGKKDAMHGLRSGVVAANTLPKFGFPITEKYPELIQSWSELTLHAFTQQSEDASPKPDNQKLPDVLAGIDQLFGENTPASLITKVALLHISLSVDPDYPTPSPLTDHEIKRFMNPTLLRLMKVMMRGDGEGWALFEPEDRARQNKYAVDAFRVFEKIVNDSSITDSFISNTKSGYDTVAPEYAERFKDEMDDKPFDRDCLDRLAHEAAELGPICDMGCGPGQIARYLHRKGVSTLGVDLSPNMIAEAQRLNPEIHFHVGNMLSLPDADDSWGGIAAFYCIIHIPREHVVDALREMKRVLKPNGTLLVAFHIGEEIKHIDEWWEKPVKLDFAHYLPGEMETWLKEADYELVETIIRDPNPEVEVATRRAYLFARKPD